MNFLPQTDLMEESASRDNAFRVYCARLVIAISGASAADSLCLVGNPLDAQKLR